MFRTLGDRLISLLGDGGDSLLDSLRNIVGSVLEEEKSNRVSDLWFDGRREGEGGPTLMESAIVIE